MICVIISFLEVATDKLLYKSPYYVNCTSGLKFNELCSFEVLGSILKQTGQKLTAEWISKQIGTKSHEKHQKRKGPEKYTFTVFEKKLFWYYFQAGKFLSITY